MHVEKRRLKGGAKFYLAHAIRTGAEVRKIRVYLGSDKNEASRRMPLAEATIKERIKAYEAISDPFKTVLTAKELKEIKTLEAKGRIIITHLTEKDWKLFTEAFAYDTNAIEGSTVTFSEVRSILEKKEWPREREKWEISETYGVSDAIDYTRKTKDHISLSLMKELHRIIFRNSKPFAGSFRKIGEEVCVADSSGRIVHRGAPSVMVAGLLKDLVKWYDENKGKYQPITLAAVVHNQFENVHPFRDGNGRIGRLLLNNILIKHNKPPVNIELRNRKEYYAALRMYEHDGNLRPTIELILKECRRLKRFLKRR